MISTPPSPEPVAPPQNPPSTVIIDRQQFFRQVMQGHVEYPACSRRSAAAGRAEVHAIAGPRTASDDVHESCGGVEGV